MSCGVTDAQDQPGSEAAPDTPVMRKKRTPTKCLKCPNKPTVLLRGLHGYCRDCFDAAVMHKARMQLGKYRNLILDKKVVVALSGGSRSTFLLHLIHHGVALDHRRKLRVDPVFVHIDESAVLPSSSPAYSDSLEVLRHQVEQCGFKLLVVPLERAFEGKGPHLVVGSNQPPSSQSEDDMPTTERLKRLFAATKSLSAKEDLLRTIKSQLLRQVAAEQGCQQVFTGECSTTLATRVMADIANGRGAFIHDITSFIDERFAIPFVRPLRELAAREIALFNYLNGLDVLPFPPLSLKTQTKASIERLTEHFMASLEREHTASISNTLRTSEKITHDEGTVHDQKCPLCGIALEGKFASHLAEKAVVLSGSSVAPPVSAVSSGEEASCGGGSCSCRSEQGSSSAKGCVDVSDMLCYGCRITLRDVANGTILPPDAAKAAEQVMHREVMRSQIEDFLLDDDV